MTLQTTRYQANLSLWLNCNLKCPYCYGNPTPPPRQWAEDIAPQLNHLLDFLDATGTWTLTMSGGEVTIYPGFADLCRRLDEAGHRVEFFSNGVRPFADAFPEDTIHHVARVGLSYQLGSEKSAKLDQVFSDNIDFLQDGGVEVDVNYVMYPERPTAPDLVKKRFLAQGTDFRFLAFQGEHGGKQYPFAYTAEEKAAFGEYGDLRAAFLMEHAYHMPTFKKCRAGFETFNISLRKGQVYLCEQLQQKPLADFTSPDGAQQFLAKVAAGPITCPAKRCSCRLTVDQENFLAENDVWDMSLYEQWEQLSLPLPVAMAHWDRQEEGFCQEIASRLTGGDLYLWAGGVHTLNLLRRLDTASFPFHRIKGIIESNSLKHGMDLCGIPIISLEQFQAHGAAGCTDILISSRAFEEEIAGVIADEFGDRFQVIRLYDGQMLHQFEAVDDTVAV